MSPQNIMLRASSYTRQGTGKTHPWWEKSEQWLGAKRELSVEVQEGTFWDKGNVLYLNKDVGYQVYAFIQTLQTVCLIPVQFSLYREKLIKKGRRLREGEMERETERERENQTTNAMCRHLGFTNYCKKTVLYPRKLECGLYGHVDDSKGLWICRCKNGKWLCKKMPSF